MTTPNVVGDHHAADVNTPRRWSHAPGGTPVRCIWRATATPLRILAGAGSGKIRVLTRRIAHQVLVEGIDPSHVLAVTFTRKTARDAPRSIGVGRGSTTASSSLQRLSASEATLADVSQLDRITSDPEICHGQPVVRGLRYPVQLLLELMSSGMSLDEILADYEDLERDDLLAALEFGAIAAGGHKVPLGAA